MSEQKPPAGDAATTAAGRPIPEQVVREPATAPDVTRPTVPDQAAAPVEETLTPVEETVVTAEEAAPAEPMGNERARNRERNDSERL